MSFPTSDGGIPAARVVVVEGGRSGVGLVLGLPEVRVVGEVGGVVRLRAVDVREDPVLAVGDVPVDGGDSAEDPDDVVGVDVIEEVGGDVIEEVGDGSPVDAEVGDGSPVDEEVGDERPAALHAPATITSASMKTGPHR